MANVRSPIGTVAIGLAIVALASASGALGWWVARSRVKIDAAATTIASDFRLQSLDGGVLGPSSYPDQVVVVDFWATWCGPCKVQTKILAMLVAELDAAPVRFLAVNVAEDEQLVREFVGREPFPYPVLLDADGEVANNIGVFGLPTVAIYGRDGELVFQQAGVADKPTLLRLINDELGASVGDPAEDG